MGGKLPILSPTDGNLSETESHDDERMEESEEQKKKQVSTQAGSSDRVIKEIADVTSQYVAKYGIEFEKRIMDSNVGEAKYSFLHSSDPLYVDYQERLTKARSQNKQDESKGLNFVINANSGYAMTDDLRQALKNSDAETTRRLERSLKKLIKNKQEQEAEDEVKQEQGQKMPMVDFDNFTDDEDEEIVDPRKEFQMEMYKEEIQLVEAGVIVKNWETPFDQITRSEYAELPVTRNQFPIKSMTNVMRLSLIYHKFKEQSEESEQIDRMIGKIKQTTVGPNDEIVPTIATLAEQPKQKIWDDHTASIGRTTTQALSQTGEDQYIHMLNDARQQQLMVNRPMMPGQQQFMVNRPMMPGQQQFMVNRPMMPGQQQFMVNRPMMHQSMMMNQQGILPQFGFRQPPNTYAPPTMSQQRQEGMFMRRQPLFPPSPLGSQEFGFRQSHLYALPTMSQQGQQDIFMSHQPRIHQGMFLPPPLGSQEFSFRQPRPYDPTMSQGQQGIFMARQPSPLGSQEFGFRQSHPNALPTMSQQGQGIFMAPQPAIHPGMIPPGPLREVPQLPGEPEPKRQKRGDFFTPS